jgi:hypothetical protein
MQKLAVAYRNYRLLRSWGFPIPQAIFWARFFMQMPMT